MASRQGVLLVGNFLSASKGTRFYCEELADRLERTGMPVFRTSTRLGRLARLADMLATCWRMRRCYDVAYVDVYSGASFFWADIISRLLRFLGKPYVVVLRGGRLSEFAESHRARMRSFLQRATEVATPSLYLQQAFQTLRSSIRYIPNAIDVDKYPFRLRTRPAPHLCWLRAFDDTYDPLMAIETIELLRNPVPEARLSMVGPTRDPELFDTTRRAIAEKGLASAVKIVGSVPKAEVPMTLAQHDIFLNTTRYESFGVAVLEAAACGLPVVSTSVGEIPYLWQDGENVLLVEQGDSAAMARAVLRLLTEEGLAEKISRAGRSNAETFGWDKILVQWLDLFGALSRSQYDA
jgi:glycosyltransferase involved in cell wall biosynthesis